MTKDKKTKDKKQFVDDEGREIKRTNRSKFKCATSGRYECELCGKSIDRGDFIRLVDVKYADKSQERYSFCSKEHRNEYCDTHGIPQDKEFK